MYVCIYVCMYVCMHACMHLLCIYLFIFIFIYFFLSLFIYVYIHNVRATHRCRLLAQKHALITGRQRSSLSSSGCSLPILRLDQFGIGSHVIFCSSLAVTDSWDWFVPPCWFWNQCERLLINIERCCSVSEWSAERLEVSSDDSQMIIEVISPSVSDLALDCLRCFRLKLLSAKNSLEFKVRYTSFLWATCTPRINPWLIEPFKGWTRILVLWAMSLPLLMLVLRLKLIYNGPCIYTYYHLYYHPLSPMITYYHLLLIIINHHWPSLTISIPSHPAPGDRGKGSRKDARGGHGGDGYDRSIWIRRFCHWVI